MAVADVLLAEIERGGVRPVYLLLGEDRGSKEEVVQSVKKSLFKNSEESTAGSSVFYGDETPVYAIVEALGASSMFSAKSLVVVHDFDRIGNKKPILEYAERPDKDTVLMLLSEKNSMAKSVTDAVLKHGKAATFWTMFQNEGERWLSRYLKRLGVNAEQEAVGYIVEVTGTGKLEMKSQAEHIVNYLEKDEPLALDTAKRIITKLYRYTVFDLANRLFIAKPGEIISVFRWLVRTGEDLVKIEYFCIREIGKIARALAMLRENHTFPQIVKKLGFRKSESARINRILSTVTEQRIRSIYTALTELDRTLKSKPKDVGLAEFEMVLIRMAG
ncbi:MAG: DNA polymerase III subunit delta [Spirochaetes bacterium]|nr:DNA polymerase III subunit delta [Spirochaetota bacterium]